MTVTSRDSYLSETPRDELVYSRVMSSHGRFKRIIPTSIAAAVVCIGLTGGVLALTTQSDVTVCVDKQSGAMRQESRRNRCERATENRIIINQQGPTGATGSVGATGAVGPVGPAGAPGVNGLSTAYYRVLDASLYLDSANSTVVGRISDVAPGSYLVFFNTDIMNVGQSQYFSCGFETQPSGGQRKIWIPATGEVLVDSRWTYSKNGLVTVTEVGGTIEVHCKVEDTPNAAFLLSNGSMIALAVNEVTASARQYPNP